MTKSHRRATSTNDALDVISLHNAAAAETEAEAEATTTTSAKKLRRNSIAIVKQTLGQASAQLRSWMSPRKVIYIPSVMYALTRRYDATVRAQLEELDDHDHYDWARVWSIIITDPILAGTLRQLPRIDSERYIACLELACKRSRILENAPDLVVDMICQSLVDFYTEVLCDPKRDLLHPDDVPILLGEDGESKKKVHELIRWQMVGSVFRAEDLVPSHPVHKRIVSLSSTLFWMFTN